MFLTQCTLSSPRERLKQGTTRMPTERTAQPDKTLINFQSVLTGLGDNITIIDQGHQVIFQNTLCQQVYACQIGKKCYEGFRSQLTPCPDCPARKVFQGEGIVKTEQLSNNDNNQWAELIASPLTSEEGAIIGAIIIKRDITEAKTLAANKELQIQQLQKTLDETRTLSGFLPICIFCKKIRDHQEEWISIETFLQHRLDIEFSHGICPECGQKHYSAFIK
jgi:transcriptional regulator with PAS, ATPase and Fis domain